jgi:CDP-2,3-bis-(O-geranylgeranyl)-sn-glycerol synthase
MIQIYLENISSYVLSCIWFILPAYVGNMAPVFAKRLFKDRFSTPIDFDRNFRDTPIAGKNKTYRGLFAAIILSTVVVLIQKMVYFESTIHSISLIDYSKINWLLWGLLMGSGAMFGDFIKSIIKRRIGKKPGESWKPLDQVDFLGGALFLCSPLYLPSLDIILGIFLLLPILKISLDRIGYHLKIHDAKW